MNSPMSFFVRIPSRMTNKASQRRDFLLITLGTAKVMSAEGLEAARMKRTEGKTLKMSRASSKRKGFHI